MKQFLITLVAGVAASVISAELQTRRQAKGEAPTMRHQGELQTFQGGEF